MTPAEASLEAVRRSGAAVPPALLWLVKRELLRSDSEGLPQLGLAPWFLCPEREIMPLSKRWPGHLPGLDAVPFARAIVRGDELACLVLRSSEVIVIEYDLFSGDPPVVKVQARFENFEGWLRALLNEAAEWILLMTERGLGP